MNLLLETGDIVLLETGDKILLDAAAASSQNMFYMFD